MDGTRFDTLTRLVQEAGSRRGALRAALGGAAASAAVVAGLARSGGEIEAKKKKCKKKKCPACEALIGNAACTTNLQCCPNETNRICAFSSTATTATKTCCGVTGATCTTDADCCAPSACDAGRCN